MTSRLDQYRAGAVRCERQANKARDPAEREWKLCLARAYRMLAEVEAERTAGEQRRLTRTNRAAA